MSGHRICFVRAILWPGRKTTAGFVPVRGAAPPPEKRSSCSADGRTRWRRSHPAGLAGLISAIQSRRRATPWPVSACTAGTEEHGAPAHGFGPSSGCTTRRPSTFFCACVLGVFFIFIFFKNIFYRNIFSISQFTVLYPYRPAGGRQGACRPAAGRQAPSKDHCAIFFIYI